MVRRDDRAERFAEWRRQSDRLHELALGLDSGSNSVSDGAPGSNMTETEKAEFLAPWEARHPSPKPVLSNCRHGSDPESCLWCQYESMHPED